MYGLGKTELSAQLAATVLDAVDDISRQFEYEEFDHLARNAQVETADKLWPQHLNHLQDVALSCAIAGPTHRAAVGEFIEQAHSSFQAFLDDVNREVVPSILALDTAGERRNQTEQPIVIGNEILSVLA
jgi:preprotein translocase subunit SecA